MIQLRVRELIKGLSADQRKDLKKLLPKSSLSPPELPTAPYPAALLSIFPKDECYSLLGCVAEELLRVKPIDLTSLSVSIRIWFSAYTGEMEKKLEKSETTERFLKNIRATQDLMAAKVKGDLAYDTVVSHEQVQGHPDAETQTQIFEVKLTGQLEKNWLDFLFQVYAYAALKPSATDIYLVLPLQQAVWHADVTTWSHRIKYRDFLNNLSVERQIAESTPSPGQLLKDSHHIGHHLEKGKLVETIRGLKESVAPIQIFLGPPISTRLAISDEKVEEAAAAMLEVKGCNAYVHAAYIINLAMEPGSKDEASKSSLNSLKPGSTKQALSTDYGVSLLVKTLGYATRIGFKGVVVHVGKSVKRTVTEAIENMRANLLKAIPHATKTCPILLETPAGQGTELLTDYDDFLEFVESFADERLRVCIDTCHVYATGYCPYEYLKGATTDYLPLVRLVHFNDSHGVCNSCVDRHAFIGTGEIGLEVMTKVADLCKAHRIDMVVE
jgi:deoxyribonuclease-4